MTVVLPNIRKLFIPDPGFVILDADLSGADAQVVAWEANDADLKAAFRAGVKIHDKNATDLFGERYTKAEGDRGSKSTPKGAFYDQCKRAVHATNYGAAARTLHLTPEIGWPQAECEHFQRRWFSLHPGIKTNFHKKVEHQLFTSRTASNAFGYRIIYFDRIDSLFSEAVAWVPQSTVAEVCFRGALALEAACPWVEILIQVHDSLVFQIPKTYYHETRLKEIHSALHVPVPYPDPLIIPWKLSASDKSWGDCREIDLK
jgi:DNA polymerase I-like protein with 3'-5' exonuclease and polymerase domains